MKVGDSVRRPAGPWTPAVQSLLSHLRDVGFLYAPTPLGIDDLGRDTVAFIEGDAGTACWDHIVTKQGLRRFGHLLRDYHTASKSFSHPDDAQWKLPAVPGETDRVVCHGDFTPWNVVWHEGSPVGLIDWEFARPGNRFDDLAWASIWSVPLRSDGEAVDGWACWPEPPDRRHRLRQLLDAYGAGNPGMVIDHAIHMLQRTVADVHALAQQGYEPQRSWVQSGAARHDHIRAKWISANRARLL